MALLLGVDTGGTYTDAVLIRDEAEVIASAKSLTTRHDLAIGIGVNLVVTPDAGTIEPTQFAPVGLMSETGVRITPEEFLDVLAPAFAHWEHQFTTYGFAPVREAWMTRAARLGEVITARTGTEEITGTFETVDGTGNLVLSTSKGRRAISAAEVFF